MQDVASHIAERACTVIPPSAPVPRLIKSTVRIEFCRSCEQIPVESVGYRIHFFGGVESLRPYRTVGGTLHLCNLSYLSVPYPVAHLLCSVPRRTLVTHGGCHTCRCGELRQKTRFVHRVRQRFLTIHMLTECHGIRSDDSVGMVCRCYYHSIDGLVHLLVHLTIVPISLCVGELLKNTLCIIPVHITESNDVFGVFHCIDIGMSHTADTNNGDIQLVRRSFVSVTFAQNRTWSDCETGYSRRSCFKKISS